MPTGIERVEGISFEVGGHGQPVLLLHTGLWDRRMWDPHWEALCARYTAIRFDARGFGESDDPRDRLSPHGDARTVLAAAGFESALVMGVSMGGEVAVDLTLTHPECVAGLVAVSTTPSGTQPPSEFAAQYEEIEELIDRGDFETANEAEMRIWVDGPGQLKGRVDASLRAKLAEANLALLRRHAPLDPAVDELEPPASERLGEIAAPAMVVTGALDQPSVLAGSRAIVEATGGRRVEFPDAAHFPNLERPTEFLEAVIPFLDEHSRAT